MLQLVLSYDLEGIDMLPIRRLALLGGLTLSIFTVQEQYILICLRYW